MDKVFLGIDIGGTKCSVLLGYLKNDEIVIIEHAKFLTEAKKGFKYVLGNLFATIDSILAHRALTSQNIVSIGISCGGPLNSKTGQILSPPNLYGWDNIPIVQIIEQKYGIKTYLQNDANACALAEWKFGAARGYENIIFLTFGTGMGAGLILNGKLYDGTNGMAGEVGHIRLAENGPVGFGKAGSFEGFCSGGGIAQIARTKVIERLQVGEHPSICDDYSKLDLLNARSVAAAADSGDELAKEIYECSARYLGQGIALLIDILNPQVIVIGSIYQRSEHLFQQTTAEVIRKEAIAASSRCCKILPASLCDRLGDYASLSVAVSGIEGWLPDLLNF